MANTKISDLPGTTTLTDEDAIPVVQEGITKKFTGVLTALKTLLGIGNPETLQTQSKEVVGAVNELNGNLSKVKVYVGNDGKLHFVNSGGADTALNFSSGKLYTGNCEYEGTDVYTASINLANISKSKLLVLQSMGVSGNSYRACIIYVPSVDMFGLLEGVSSNGFIWVSDIPYSFPTANKMTISGAIPGTGFVWRNPAGCQGIKYYAVI